MLKILTVSLPYTVTIFSMLIKCPILVRIVYVYCSLFISRYSSMACAGASFKSTVFPYSKGRGWGLLSSRIVVVL